MPTFKASKVPRKEVSLDDVLARFCYHFPQYKYHEAKLVPLRRITAMLKEVEREKARYMVDLTRAMAGSQSKKGFSDVLSYFEKIIKG